MSGDSSSSSSKEGQGSECFEGAGSMQDTGTQEPGS